MRKLILTFVFASALLMALAVGLLGVAGTASADVHGVSQAGCGVSPNSGATNQASRDADGRPDAPIPRTASDGRSDSGRGGAADANC